MAKKVIILDRDGVINYDSKNYIKSPDEWMALPGSCEAIGQLSKNGWNIAIATNQSGIGRSLFSLETYRKIELKMKHSVSYFGGFLDYIVYCPHTPEDNCNCRKPKPGMLKKICRHFAVLATDCYFVGDGYHDIEAARAAGCKPVLVLTGNGYATKDTQEHDLTNVVISADLAAFSIQLLSSK